MVDTVFADVYQGGGKLIYPQENPATSADSGRGCMSECSSSGIEIRMAPILCSFIN